MRESKQRDIVYKVVHESYDHPDAETVLLRCKELMPTINLATVYRNLKTLSTEGVIKKISLTSGDRFDTTISSHAHFKCEKCKKFFDIDEIPLDKIEKTSYKGVGDIDCAEVILIGTCIDCKEQIN